MNRVIDIFLCLLLIVTFTGCKKIETSTDENNMLHIKIEQDIPQQSTIVDSVYKQTFLIPANKKITRIEFSRGEMFVISRERQSNETIDCYTVTRIVHKYNFNKSSDICEQ